jgi:hypothetical protein
MSGKQIDWVEEAKAALAWVCNNLPDDSFEFGGGKYVIPGIEVLCGKTNGTGCCHDTDEGAPDWDWLAMHRLFLAERDDVGRELACVTAETEHGRLWLMLILRDGYLSRN